MPYTTHWNSEYCVKKKKPSRHEMGHFPPLEKEYKGMLMSRTAEGYSYCSLQKTRTDQWENRLCLCVCSSLWSNWLVERITTTLTLIFSCLFSLIFLSCTFAFHRYDSIFKKSLVGGTGLVKFPAKALTRILVKNQQQQLTINENKWQTTTKTKRESMFM